MGAERLRCAVDLAAKRGAVSRERLYAEVVSVLADSSPTVQLPAIPFAHLWAALTDSFLSAKASKQAHSSPPTGRAAKVAGSRVSIDVASRVTACLARILSRLGARDNVPVSDTGDVLALLLSPRVRALQLVIAPCLWMILAHHFPHHKRLFFADLVALCARLEWAVRIAEASLTAKEVVHRVDEFLEASFPLEAAGVRTAFRQSLEVAFMARPERLLAVVTATRWTAAGVTPGALSSPGAGGGRRKAVAESIDHRFLEALLLGPALLRARPAELFTEPLASFSADAAAAGRLPWQHVAPLLPALYGVCDAEDLADLAASEGHDPPAHCNRDCFVATLRRLQALVVRSFLDASNYTRHETPLCTVLTPALAAAVGVDVTGEEIAALAALPGAANAISTTASCHGATVGTLLRWRSIVREELFALRVAKRHTSAPKGLGLGGPVLVATVHQRLGGGDPSRRRVVDTALRVADPALPAQLHPSDVVPRLAFLAAVGIADAPLCRVAAGEVPWEGDSALDNITAVEALGQCVALPSGRGVCPGAAALALTDIPYDAPQRRILQTLGQVLLLANPTATAWPISVLRSLVVACIRHGEVAFDGPLTTLLPDDQWSEWCGSWIGRCLTWYGATPSPPALASGEFVVAFSDAVAVTAVALRLHRARTLATSHSDSVCVDVGSARENMSQRCRAAYRVWGNPVALSVGAVGTILADAGALEAGCAPRDSLWRLLGLDPHRRHVPLDEPTLVRWAERIAVLRREVTAHTSTAPWAASDTIQTCAQTLSRQLEGLAGEEVPPDFWQVAARPVGCAALLAAADTVATIVRADWSGVAAFYGCKCGAGEVLLSETALVRALEGRHQPTLDYAELTALTYMHSTVHPSVGAAPCPVESLEVAERLFAERDPHRTGVIGVDAALGALNELLGIGPGDAPLLLADVVPLLFLAQRRSDTVVGPLPGEPPVLRRHVVDLGGYAVRPAVSVAVFRDVCALLIPVADVLHGTVDDVVSFAAARVGGPAPAVEGLPDDGGVDELVDAVKGFCEVFVGEFSTHDDALLPPPYIVRCFATLELLTSALGGRPWGASDAVLCGVDAHDPVCVEAVLPHAAVCHTLLWPPVRWWSMRRLLRSVPSYARAAARL